jgi:hypothetical protein
MGVWERSPAGVAIALRNDALMDSFRQALPDVRPDDVVGSPYCIRDYAADPHLGGPAALAAARWALAERGMALILDFVPNHLAPDHPWTSAHPEYFVGGDEDDLARDPSSFVRVGDSVLACGRVYEVGRPTLKEDRLQRFLMGRAGIEPATLGLKVPCSTN